jgi:hypothetical protein
MRRSGRVVVGVFDFWGTKPMTRAHAVDLSEEHLGLAAPGHLRELVHGSDEHRRQQPIDLLVHHDDRKALARGSRTREVTLAEGVTAKGQCARATTAVRLHLDVTPRLDPRAAPRTVRQLRRRADTTPELSRPASAVRLTQGFRTLLGRVRRRTPPHPEPDTERRPAPAGLVLSPDDLTRAQQCRGTLELLERQQAQRVAHQDGDARLPGTPRHGAVQTTNGQGVRSQAKVCFRLLTAGGEPEKIGGRRGRRRSIGMV